MDPGADIPPPPAPPTSGKFTRGDTRASSPRSSRSSFVLDDGSPSGPRSSMGHVTPEMWDAMKKFTEAGGYEGMKKRIVEEGAFL